MIPNFYKLQNFEILGRRRPPGGFWMVQKWFPDSASSSFLLHLLKTRNFITVKYAQSYLESTFGWTNLLPKNSKLKLVFKEAKRNQGKQAFLGILAWFGGSQYEALKFLSEYNFLHSKETTMHSTSFRSTFIALKNDNFP